MATLQTLGTVRLRLRLGGDDYQETLHAVQGDTGRVIEFDVLDSDGTIVTNLTGVTPVLFVRRPDGKEVGSATGEIVGGVIRITIPSSLLAYAGETKAQIQLVDSANQHKLHDHLYRLQIEESLEAGASPGENLWFSLAELTEAIAEVNLLVEQYDTDVAAVATMRDEVTTKHGEVTTMHTSLQDVFDTEQERRTAESARISAETDRATEESKRKTAETARADAEDQRAEDEDMRLVNEDARQNNESTRVSAENARKIAETARQTKEDQRETAEADRVSAESVRQSNESGRVSNETARIQQWSTWEGLIEDGAMPNATSTTAGAVKVDALGTESAPYTTVTTGKLASDLTGKVDKISGKGLSTYDYTYAAKSKVDAIPASPKYTDTVTTINGKTGAIAKSDITALGIPAQDTVYTHPSTHPASMITQDSARRMVSDTQIASWTDKVDKAGGQMTGELVTQPSGDTRQARNIAIGTTAPTSTVGYSEGDIFLVVP